MSDGYELNTEPRTPALPGSVVVREDREELLDALAADLLVQSASCISAFGDFHLALGSAPLVQELIIKLMVDPKYRSIEWIRTHLWTVHESRVPVGHPEHSLTVLSELLVEPSDMPPDQVHPILGHHPQACELYQSELREQLGQREKGQDRLDFVVIDPEPEHIRGHDDPADRLVGVLDSGRLTLCNRMIGGSRMVAVGLSGAPARDTVKVLESGALIPGIEPVGGVLRWYLDHDACVQAEA
ncbi:MAG: 6-phosphogluconolactonase [Phycisphaerales bacterium]|nr:6-phosphogluconolactonase [Phycisphaerales bacterium]